MYYIFCSHSSVEEHLGSFQLLAIINKAAMNIVMDHRAPNGGTLNSLESPKEMFNILSHQGNANQKDPEIPSHTSQNG